MGAKQSDLTNCQEKGFLACCSPGDPGDTDNGDIQPPQTRTLGDSGAETPVGTAPRMAPRVPSAERSPNPPSAPGRQATEDDYAPAPAPDYSSQAPAPPPAPVAGGPVVSLDLVLSDLESAEQMAYEQAFASFSGKSCNTPVPLDCAALRDFVCSNSAVSIEDLDLELIRAGASLDDNTVSLEAFLLLLRENAVPEAVAIGQFLGLSGNGESMAAEECRSGLLLFGQRELSARFSEEQWDRILTTAMMEADITIMMEGWITCCKRVARVVRLSRYARFT
eukprot:gnl/TRDRNA2_/TRDRNA2_198153_c0_seq1.p1 gnl/TRDRNA2_/TRDRNA2_198153_c0~~gnl/TRDRNA2_/TRDRNA2_198153_c0_seq1.p1  ORF type:complete len:279 (-),score=30.71 gnl/TRDRNA2_/TRDRNA2_198153_c0_seq1:23-859(-)